MKYDIFISYKRKSLPTANNLYYRLTTKGYSTFFDLEEMRRDNFDTQLLQYIENANDVFVILEEGSLDGCKKANWKEEDWFCHEIAFALEKGKNIIPILLNGYVMPEQQQLPDELKELSLKNAPEFSFSFFDEYIEKLISKEYITSKAVLQNAATSIFKFYSNENCQIFKEGKLVCSLEGNSDEPYYLPVVRKGSYRFKCINTITLEEQLIKETIDADEEKEVEIVWKDRNPLNQDIILHDKVEVNGDTYMVEVGNISFNMIRIEGGTMNVGATTEQFQFADSNEYPPHEIHVKTFYMAEFPVTQNLWELVMGYNKSHFREKHNSDMPLWSSALVGSSLVSLLPAFGPVGAIARGAALLGMNKNLAVTRGHLPVANITHSEALEFVKRLSNMTGIKFSLPTEEEWEYTARGGNNCQGFVFAGSNSVDDVAWYKDNSDGKTHPVGEKAPNELGLYDMSGNVWEWTETLAHSYSDTSTDREGSKYIRRGGSWWHDSKNCRVSKRYASDETKKTSGLGLRVVIRLNSQN